MHEICQELGFPVAEEKDEGPATSLQFLGLEVDTEVMEIRLPQSKLGIGKYVIQMDCGISSTNVKYCLMQLNRVNISGGHVLIIGQMRMRIRNNKKGCVKQYSN